MPLSCPSCAAALDTDDGDLDDTTNVAGDVDDDPGNNDDGRKTANFHDEELDADDLAGMILLHSSPDDPAEGGSNGDGLYPALPRPPR